MLIGCAYAMGLVTPGLIQRLTRSDTTEQGPVLVASRDLSPGMRITLQDVELESWPSEMIPPDAATDRSTVLGKIVRSPVNQGQPIIEMNPASPFASTFEVPSGYRVLAIEFKHNGSFSRGVRQGGLLNVVQIGPGDKVNIVVPDVRAWSTSYPSQEKIIVGVCLTDAEIESVRKLQEAHPVYVDYSDSLSVTQ